MKQIDLELTYYGSKFTCRCFNDVENGCGGLELYETGLMPDAQPELVGKIVYWDAAGGWWVDLFTDVPLFVLEKFAEQAKNAMPTE